MEDSIIDLNEKQAAPINLAIELDLEPGGVTAVQPDGETGTMTIYARFRLDFTGNIQEMAGTLLGITAEEIAGAVSGAMVDLLGEEIAEGGCYVQG